MNYDRNFRDLNGLLINARSIRNKVPQLQALLQLHNINLVAITETWLDASVKTAEIFPSSYQVFRKERKDKRGGGVLFAFKNSLKVTLRTDLVSNNPNHNEILVVDILCAKLVKIALILCYRPPNDYSDEFLENFKSTLNLCDASHRNL